MLTLKRFIELMKKAHAGKLPLNIDQRKAIEHSYKTPLWMIAGPGTGKTHTLSWLLLKRILVDGLPLERIIITTFTRKAAAELVTRLILQRDMLIGQGLSEARDIDLSQLKVGTLHGLCSRIMQDHRYEPTLRIRVLEDELTQQFFVRRSRNDLTLCDDLPFWARFGMVRPNDQYGPTKAKKVENACKVFNRLTENRVAPGDLIASGDHIFVRLGQAYQQYKEALTVSHRTDQAHLQQHLLDFLGTQGGKAWLGGGFTVLVDEYQDTNPIQEEIYFSLAGCRGDITVVGDDDQSLYRFRGATVESLIDFDRACMHYLGRRPTPVYLVENRRSHPGIVEWVNRFIEHHPEMSDPKIRVRAPGKPSITPAAKVDGNYPPVMAIVENSNPGASQKMVGAIQELIAGGLLTDYSQIALLTFSTKENQNAIGAYTAALGAAGIPFSNPRNKMAHRDEAFSGIIGALSFILDPGLEVGTLPAQLPQSVATYLTLARGVCQAHLDSGSFPSLAKYIADSTAAVSGSKFDTAKKKNYLLRKGGRRVTLAGLLYKLLAHEPFASRLGDQQAGGRLKALTLVLSEFESMYSGGEIGIEPDPAGGCRVSRWDLYNFYNVFVEGIHDGLNDPEDQEVSLQPGAINIMTIHQSKGLQFEVVFVLRPDKQPLESDTHVLEDIMEPFVKRQVRLQRRPSSLRAAEDAIRLFFVAYSRTKRLLIITGSNVSKWDRALGRDGSGKSLNSKAGLQSVGVHIL